MNSTSVSLSAAPDALLWQRSQVGDREAFAQIVARYQALICSVAYCTSGSLARAEDIAQETFVTAWQRLGELRDPTRLRAWLCGIARHRAANAARRERRRGGPLESLDAVTEPVTSAPDPADAAIHDEEAALVWRALATLPDNYREPLVLFYRQEQSVAEVAASLELSVDTAKQRLSRGRAMLRDELAALVEKTLTRTRPTAAFTTAVLAAIAAITPRTAEAALVASAGVGPCAAGKSWLALIGKWTLLGPAVGLLASWFCARTAASTARSPEERACLLRYARRIVIYCWLMSLGLVVVLLGAGRVYPASPIGLVVGILSWVVLLVGPILWATGRLDREVARIRAATATDDAAYNARLATHGLQPSGPWRYESRWRLLGLPVVAIAIGSGEATSRVGPRTTVGWLACGDTALSPLVAIGGVAVAPLALGAITVGFLSFSLWGVAIGALAFGSVAVGWWAYGLGALGWQSAAGGAAAAREYALGSFAQAAEANTPGAQAWFASQWFTAPVDAFLHHAHWLILAIIIMCLGGLWHRARQRRALTQPTDGR